MKEKGQTWHCKPIKPKENGHSSGLLVMWFTYVPYSHSLGSKDTIKRYTHWIITVGTEYVGSNGRNRSVQMRETHLDERTVHHGTCEHLRLRTCRLFVLQILLTDLTEAKSLTSRQLKCDKVTVHLGSCCSLIIEKRFRPCCASLGPLWGWCSSGQTDWPQQPVGDCPP